MSPVLSAESGLAALRAIAEPTRLRIIILLATGELTVKDLTRVLGQSQPRISRHLKLMYDAGLLARIQEGSWVYFRLSDHDAVSSLLRAMVDRFDRDDDEFRRDRERAEEIRRERSDRAQAFFAAHAARWDELRALHVDEREVEARIQSLVGDVEGDLVVDLGTGTGRILELLAGRFRRAIGVDTNPEMLGYARARTQSERYAHVQIRHGDICHLAIGERSADLVTIHQVLHYLADPRAALREAARILRPSARLLVVDFSAHQIDRLRDEFAHQRLGFSNEQMTAWLEEVGLALDAHEELPPARVASPLDGEGLTVSLWLAVRHQSGQLERTQTERILEMAR